VHPLPGRLGRINPRHASAAGRGRRLAPVRAAPSWALAAGARAQSSRFPSPACDPSGQSAVSQAACRCGVHCDPPARPSGRPRGAMVIDRVVLQVGGDLHQQRRTGGTGAVR